MNCSELRDLLEPFLDDELETAQSVALLKHSELCPPCRARLEQGRRLHEMVNQAAGETLDEATRARLLAGAFTPKTRRFRWQRLAAAAVFLLGFGLGGLAWLDPFCWYGCPTMRVVLVAAKTAQNQGPEELTQLKDRFPRRLEAPAACGVICVGGNLVAVPGSVGDRPLYRLRCKRSGQRVAFLRLPGAHAHFWQERLHHDGRRYVEAEAEGVRVVAWHDAEGMACCIGEGDLPRDSHYAMAAAVRDAGS